MLRIFIPYRLHYKYFEKICTKYNDDKNGFLEKVSFRTKSMKYYKMEQDWYRDTIELPFEDIKISYPIDYEKVLVEMYGENYMTPIKGASTHGKLIISVDKSYKELLMNKK